MNNHSNNSNSSDARVYAAERDIDAACAALMWDVTGDTKRLFDEVLAANERLRQILRARSAGVEVREVEG